MARCTMMSPQTLRCRCHSLMLFRSSRSRRVPCPPNTASTRALHSTQLQSPARMIFTDLFEFVRNYKFNGRNFFSSTKDFLKRNQFGGSLGGPIKANKLFFFGGYQGTTTRQDPVP